VELGSKPFKIVVKRFGCVEDFYKDSSHFVKNARLSITLSMSHASFLDFSISRGLPVLKKAGEGTIPSSSVHFR
jgi:hypothetical protein